MTPHERHSIVLGAVVAKCRGATSQVDLARRAGISQSTVSRIENGQGAGVFELTSLARALGMTTSNLLDITDATLVKVKKAADAISRGSFDRCDITGLVQFVLAAE